MKKISIICGVFLYGAYICAAEPLSLNEARRLALAHSPALAQSALTVRGTALDEKARIRTLFPALSAGASAQANLWGTPGFEQSISAGVNAGMSQKIYDGGKSSVQKNINTLSMSMAREDSLAAQLSVLEAADSAFYDLLAAQAALAAAQAALDSAEFVLNTATVRMQTGMMSYGDYLQVLADKESKEGSRNQARRGLSLAGLKLGNLTGLPEISELVELDSAAIEALIRRFAALDETNEAALYGALWSAALKDNPALSRAELSRRTAQHQVSLAARDYFPALSASLSTGLSYYLDGGEAQLRNLALSLNLTIPLDYGVTANTVAKRELDRDKAALSYQDAEMSLALDVQSAVMNCVTQAEAALSAQRSSEYAERRYEYVRERFRLLQSSSGDLSDAAALLSNSRNQLINARFTFLKGISRLRSLTGIDSDEKLFALMETAAQ